MFLRDEKSSRVGVAAIAAAAIATVWIAGCGAMKKGNGNGLNATAISLPGQWTRVIDGKDTIPVQGHLHRFQAGTALTYFKTTNAYCDRKYQLADNGATLSLTPVNAATPDCAQERFTITRLTSTELTLTDALNYAHRYQRVDPAEIPLRPGGAPPPAAGGDDRSTW